MDFIDISQSKVVENPFFSICIPQYNRTLHLIEQLKVLEKQTCQDFEVCISDDISNDGHEEKLIDYLENSSLSYRYVKQVKNSRYDVNLRTGIHIARGKYCALFGNDDCLAGYDALERLKDEIQQHDFPGIVITNFEDYRTGEKAKRILKEKCYLGGGKTAARHFRNVSFVSGVLIDRAMAQAAETEIWDGTEMYQMYLTMRIIGEGKSLLELEDSFVRKDILVAGEEVDSWEKKPKLKIEKLAPITMPFTRIHELLTQTVLPYLRPEETQKVLRDIFKQLLFFTYPYWLLEYRRAQSWRYAYCLSLSMRPKSLMKGLPLTWLSKCYITTYYYTTTAIALIVPIPLFQKSRQFLYTLAKRYSTN